MAHEDRFIVVYHKNIYHLIDRFASAEGARVIADGNATIKAIAAVLNNHRGEYEEAYTTYAEVPF